MVVQLEYSQAILKAIDECFNSRSHVEQYFRLHLAQTIWTNKNALFKRFHEKKLAISDEKEHKISVEHVNPSDFSFKNYTVHRWQQKQNK